MPSIRQNAYPDLLPDFRNLAVMARVLVGVNALALAGTLYATPTLAAALDRFVYVAAFLEPLLLIELMALFAVSPWLTRVPYAFGCAVILGLVCVLAGGYHGVVRAIANRSLAEPVRLVFEGRSPAHLQPEDAETAASELLDTISRLVVEDEPVAEVA